MSIRVTITPDGGPEMLFEADECIMHNVLQDATDIGDTYRKHEASGDQIVVLVKRGGRSRSNKLDMALTCLDSIMRRDEGVAWQQGIR